MKALTYIEHGKFVLTLREAFQERKEKNRPSQTANLGRTESRHQKARKQQSLQQKEDAGLEERASESCVFYCAASSILTFFLDMLY